MPAQESRLHRYNELLGILCETASELADKFPERTFHLVGRRISPGTPTVPPNYEVHSFDSAQRARGYQEGLPPDERFETLQPFSTGPPRTLTFGPVRLAS
jgi:hypothetical protein